MSPESRPITIPGSENDPKVFEFLGKLRDRTAQRKVVWKAWEKGFMATLPDGFYAFFFSTTKPPYKWDKFFIQANRATVFEVSKTLPDMLLNFASAADPAQRAAHELYAVVTGALDNPLDKAIESLDKL